MQIIFETVWSFIAEYIIGPLKWDRIKFLFTGRYYDLTEEDHEKIRTLLSKDHYIILTWRKTHLSTYLIAIANLIRTGKLGKWSHILLNIEDEVKDDFDYKLFESTGKGVGYNSFMNVFDCDGFCLLKPYCFTTDEWTKEMTDIKSQYGKKYDTLFNLADEEKLSCAELVYLALKKKIDLMPEFKHMLEKAKNLTPDLFYNCSEFEIIFEIRR